MARSYAPTPYNAADVSAPSHPVSRHPAWPLPAAQAAWLASAFDGLGLDAPEQLEALPAEASHRRFYRLRRRDGARWVLMVSPPELEQNAQFERLSACFAAAGLPVPRVLAKAPGSGCYLLTDQGEAPLEAAYGDAAQRRHRLGQALDLLLRLRDIRDPAIPTYSAERQYDELAIFRDWLLEARLGLAAPADWPALCDVLVAALQEQPQCCVHRDFHCRNLLLDGDGLGLVDFQDALMGPGVYDLASLLHDCYHRFDEAEVTHWLKEFRRRSGWPAGAAELERLVDLTAAQRQLKALGIFARLRLRDGKDSHERYILPVLDHLARLAARQPALSSLARWLPGIRARAAERLAAEP